MNDTRSAPFSACFHALLPQAAIVVRADGQTFAEEPHSSAEGPAQKSLLTRLDAPARHLLVVRGFGERPSIRSSLAIHFP